MPIVIVGIMVFVSIGTKTIIIESQKKEEKQTIMLLTSVYEQVEKAMNDDTIRQNVQEFIGDRDCADVYLGTAPAIGYNHLQQYLPELYQVIKDSLQSGDLINAQEARGYNVLLVFNSDLTFCVEICNSEFNTVNCKYIDGKFINR